MKTTLLVLGSLLAAAPACEKSPAAMPATAAATVANPAPAPSGNPAPAKPARPQPPAYLLM